MTSIIFAGPSASEPSCTSSYTFIMPMNRISSVSIIRFFSMIRTLLCEKRLTRGSSIAEYPFSLSRTGNSNWLALT